MLTEGALRDQVNSLFVDHLSVDVPSHETDLLESGLLDSLGFVELLVQIEKKFGVAIGLEDIEIDRFRSVSMIAACVGNKLKGM